MKKLLIIIFLFGLFNTPVLALQELDDYHFQQEKYRQVYTQYSNSKDKYLKYQTLNAKKEAENATQEVLISRASVLKTYFLLLSKRLNTTPGIEKNNQDNFNNLLNAKLSWLSDHEKVLTSLDTPELTPLFSLSQAVEATEVEARRLSFQVEGLIYLGKVKKFENNLKNFNQKLKSTQGADSTVLKQWFNQVEEKFTSLDEEIKQAQENWQFLADKEIEDKDSLQKTFAKMKKNLINTQAILKEISDFENEIQRKIEKGEI